jgi:hypothetical protein
MRLRGLLTPLKWLAVASALAGLLWAAALVHDRVTGRRAAEAEADAGPPKRAANQVVKLGAEFAESQGLRDEPAQAAGWVRRVPAYGRVVPNPRATAEVRTAFAGTLRAAPGGAWPALGAQVRAGQILGWLDVRVGPQERLDLLTKLNEAKARLRGAEELARLQQDRVARLAAAGGGVSQSELDTARQQLTEAQTQVATAASAAKDWEDAREAINRQGDRKETTWSQPLTAPVAGEVVELAGHPGMALEPGGLVARLVDFRPALVRLEIPPEALAAGPPAAVELVAGPTVPPALEGAPNRPGAEPPPRPTPARLVGTAPQVEANSQFAAFWYEADAPGVAAYSPGSAAEAPGTGVWRPGLFVKATVAVPGAGVQQAVTVPASALLYHQGRALVYVRVGPGRYERREVQVLGHENGRWFLAAGVRDGEPVVSRRAQVLLSEEFRGEADTD